MTCAGRGVSLEQRTHRPVMFQSFFCYLALRSQRLRTPLIAPMPATSLRGTGPLRSLRKAYALSCASPSMRNSGLYEVSLPFCRLPASLGKSQHGSPVLFGRSPRTVKFWRPFEIELRGHHFPLSDTVFD